MRRLFIPACLCLVSVGATTIGPATPLPVEPIATSSYAKNKSKIKRKIKRKTVSSAAATTGPGPQAERKPALKAEAKTVTKTKSKTEPAVSLAERLAPFAAALTLPQTPPAEAQAVAYAAAAPSSAPVNPLRGGPGSPLLLAPAPDIAIPMSAPPGTPPAVRKRVVYRSKREICDTVAKAAHSNKLPVPFFVRLLFQESRFDAASVSHAGAQGIAQFMPETARDVGLANPFDPLQAIPAAARLLRDFADRFGNLGLAAAAYNAGPTRVDKWLKRQSGLPAETRGYVKIITGKPADSWKATKTEHGDTALPNKAPCKAVTVRSAANKAPPRAVLPAQRGEVVASAAVGTGYGGETALQLAARSRNPKTRH